MGLTDEQVEMLAEMREEGWAVTVVSPRALDGTPRDWVENAMREAATREIGWDFEEEVEE